LPTGLSFVSSVPTCTASGQLVNCPLGDLERGVTVSIDLVTRAADPFPIDSLVNGEIVNVALVAGTESNCDNGSSDFFGWKEPTDESTAITGRIRNCSKSNFWNLG
jgi:hypothetical protein